MYFVVMLAVLLAFLTPGQELLGPREWRNAGSFILRAPVRLSGRGPAVTFYGADGESCPEFSGVLVRQHQR